MKIRAISALAVIITSVPGWAQSYVYNSSPSRAFGQSKIDVTSGAPNLVEGRELYLPLSVALDTSVSPAILYVADLGNNRVLAWKDASAFTKGDMANLAIGQADLVSTLTGGPSVGTAWGLKSPISVAVDTSGNLWVLDGQNHRILRYPQPFKQQRDYPIPDYVIGQKSLTAADGANQGSTVPSAKSISMGIVRASITFDKSGNLWVTDTNNNRVLRFPKSGIDASTANLAADLVLGQTTFDVATLPTTGNNRFNKSVLAAPFGIAISDAGDVYVSDALNRVLYFQTPTVNGKAAARLLGVDTGTVASPNPATLNGCPTIAPTPCSTVLGSYNTKTGRSVPPTGLATQDNNLYVADSGNHRIVKYGTPDTWSTECTLDATIQYRCQTGTYSPTPTAYIGQADGISVQANRGNTDAGSATLSGPTGLTFSKTTNELFVADGSNHRVLVFPQSAGVYVTASRLLGQVDWNYSSPNLVEGRELFIYGDPDQAGVGLIAGAMVIDTKNNRLYIADTFNNRVLGFKDARKVKSGDYADFVIGQKDLRHTNANFETNDVNSPTDATLYRPVGLAIDSDGNLYVADSGNSRVVRFPTPYDQIQQRGQARADLVLGQDGFFSKLPNAQATGMSEPWGIALTKDGHLAVSDNTYNRVLLFMKPFRNGQAATKVFGQNDFRSSATGTDSSHLSGPAGITMDSSDRLYVADAGNNRLSIFTDVLDLSSSAGQQAVFTPAINSPFSVAVNSRGEIWVTDPAYSRVARYPEFLTWRLAYDSTNPTKELISGLSVITPSAVALDASDNILVAEGINRVSMYYLRASLSNTASYASQRGMAPGALENIFRYLGPPLAPDGTVAVADKLPFPTTLGDMQVLVNGNPAPLYRVLSSSIVIQVPKDTPANQTADVQVIRASTGEVLTAGNLRVNPVDPGFYTNDSTGSGQIAALNEDNSRNGTDNPVAKGKIVALYGNGIGLVTNQPADGEAATGEARAPGNPVILLTPGGTVPDANILYFGLAPGSPGQFQLNFKIPDTVPITNGSKQVVQVQLSYKDALSSVGPTEARLVTTIVVK